MPLSEQFRHQVALLLETIPFVATEPDFALKGGTAINLFHRDMPRLSVDIDLTYLPVAPRPESLAAIDATMKRMAAAIRKGLPGARVTEVVNAREKILTKLTVQKGDAQIKIEVTPVIRGCVFEPELRDVSPSVEEAFGFAQMKVVSFADLYAGKLVAALDRQHPCDLFDVRDLLANEGIMDDLRKAFILYLISHDRPISEVLVPRRKDIQHEFTHGFEGLTADEATLDELLEARETLIAELAGKMPQAHKPFLIGFKRGEPDWGLLGVPSAPAVRWKQINLDKLPAAPGEARRATRGSLAQCLRSEEGTLYSDHVRGNLCRRHLQEVRHHPVGSELAGFSSVDYREPDLDCLAVSIKFLNRWP